MIKKWKNESIYYSQRNNAVEDINRKLNIQHGIKSKGLESCGVCAFLCLMEGMDYLRPSDYPSLPSGAKIQMDDWVMMYVNDPQNIFSADKNQMDNRLFKNYVKLARVLFAVESSYIRDHTWDEIKNYLINGFGVQLCLPGHYVAVGAYNEEKDCFEYRDSMKKGVHLMNKEKYNTCSNRAVVYF